VKKSRTKVIFKIFDAVACRWQRKVGLFSATRQTACIANIDNQLQIRQIEVVRHRGGSLLINEKARVNQT
jgi:hypothetical protein